MPKSRKICCRITPGRIVGTVLLAASAVNLIIVGAAFKVSFPEAVPTMTATRTTFPATITPFSATRTESSPHPVTLMPSNTPTPTSTFTSTPTATWTSTATNTATPTDTPSPTPTQCILRYGWPIYIVQGGDTLYSLSILTGTSVDQLMLANCLTSTIIYRGQRLYVPRVPVSPATASPTATLVTITPSPTPTYTPTTPPITFLNPSVCLGSSRLTNLYLSFSVTLSATQGIGNVTAFDDRSVVVTLTDTGNGTYSGALKDAGGTSPGYQLSYYFVAMDNLGQSFPSDKYTTTLNGCNSG